MDLSAEPDEIEVIARRVEFLERLQTGPAHKPDLVESLDHSRSTVDRAVKELDEAGLVTRETEGYVTTQAGRLAAERYRSFLLDQQQILAARDVLEAIPPDRPVPLELVTRATEASTDGPYRLFEHLAARLRDADRYRAVVPHFADSRHLRLCHARAVRDGTPVTVHTSADELSRLREEFPYMVAELADSSAFSARTGDVPPVGLVLTDAPETAVTLVAYGGDDVAGFLHTDDEDAVAWAEQRYESIAADTHEATAALRDAATDTDLPSLTGGRLPTTLRSEGFVRVDDRYFERREPMSPATACRAGLGLPEVHAGYAVDRTRDGDSVTGTLLDRVRDGESVALVGPPGTGKSTLCRRVACRFNEHDDAAVLYRRSAGGQPFESRATLDAFIETTRGPVLVVAEDAVRATANTVFEVMRDFDGDDDVAFLVDARESEWRDPDEFPMDARLESFRHEAVETVTMPPLTDADVERVVARVDDLTDEALAVPVADVVRDVRSESPGTISLLFHRLASYVEPLAPYEPGTPSTLDEDVDRLRRDLDDCGDLAVEVGILANVLNAAGLPVAEPYLRAGGRDPDDETAATVDEALSRLHGHVLFGSPTDGATGYRSVAETWSTRYLERVGDDREDASDRFAAAVNGLFGLADSPDDRAAVAAAASRHTAALDGIVADPTDWADEAVTTVFDLGTSAPKLAPLFGTTDASAIELPEACSDETRLRAIEARGELFTGAGALDRASAEFETLVEAARDCPDVDTDERRLTALYGRCQIARRRGEHEAAERHARERRSLAESLDSPREVAQSRLLLGQIAHGRGDLDEAEAELSAALETFEALEEPRGEAETRRERGLVAAYRGDHGTAADHLRRSLERYRDLDDRRGEASVLSHLGELDRQRRDVETASERFLRALELARDLGDRALEGESLATLANLELTAGDLDAAERHVEQAIEVAREIDERAVVPALFGTFGDVEYERGNDAAAREHYERGLAPAAEAGDSRTAAILRRGRALVLARDGDAGQALEDAERAVELAEEVGDRAVQVRSRCALATARREHGEYEAAVGALDRAHDLVSAGGQPTAVALVATERGVTERERGDLAAAAAALERALDALEGSHAAGSTARARFERGLTALAADEPAVAREHLADAVPYFLSVGADGRAEDAVEGLVDACAAVDDRETAAEWCERARDAGVAVSLGERWARRDL
ncbi:tetratricopeptide repeat protein [Haloarchaeobius iranensis]|uniref:Predicted transcriptional regulator, contains HTH domain n=1 Tax=Haloarchaeobius iranensis TaxID=996166 RepID=A0A1G9UP65_9EURY|nr:tetratricopeptide repeat protein [Haloarchaeobius iranensis]SDM61617.1 Predicted transcriptional regulator, contains HTH domain [Haloarchaeobius iranensis]